MNELNLFLYLFKIEIIMSFDLEAIFNILEALEIRFIVVINVIN